MNLASALVFITFAKNRTRKDSWSDGIKLYMDSVSIGGGCGGGHTCHYG
jgi:hypothetical protein